MHHNTHTPRRDKKIRKMFCSPPPEPVSLHTPDIGVGAVAVLAKTLWERAPERRVGGYNK